jgi:nucleoside 2-deoxyribosyltransferase
MSERRIFISYSSNDSAWAELFAKALQSRGAEVWFDRFEIRPGQPLQEAIEQGLRDSDLLVALINQENVKRPAFFFELGAAVALGKRLVGVVPPDFDVSQLPHSLRLRRYLTMKSPEITAAELISHAA